MKFALYINLGNAEMNSVADISSALRSIGRSMIHSSMTKKELSLNSPFTIRDVNGNSVGKAGFFKGGEISEKDFTDFTGK